MDLLPWDQLLELDDGAVIFEELAYGPLTREHPTAALRKRVTIPKRQVIAGGPEASAGQAAYSSLENALLCLTISGPIPVYAVGHWVALEPPVPITSSGRGWGSVTETKPGPVELTASVRDRAKALHESFEATKLSDRDAIHVPIERLGLSMRRRSTIDAAIDLGIAIEALFLQKGGGLGEYGNKISTRASRLLGFDLTSRLELAKLFNALYDMRSKAVHLGRWPAETKYAPESITEHLESGWKHMASALRIAIYRREAIEWKAIESGDTRPASPEWDEP